jgi:hypothetical protein
MNKSLAVALPILSMGLAPCLSSADDATHVGVAVTGGLSGVGLDAGVNINSYLGARITVAGLSVDHNGVYGTSVPWTAKLKLFQAGLLGDVYPFQGVFRVSAGVVDDGNKLSLTAQPSSGTYTFNGTTYGASQIGSASGLVEWRKTNPYLGIGWGNLAGSRGFHFTSDVGVLLSGSAKTVISVVCANAQVCPDLTANVAAENAKLQNDVDKLKVWPVLRFGIGYAF